jgi:hypothetical protein
MILHARQADSAALEYFEMERLCSVSKLSDRHVRRRPRISAESAAALHAREREHTVRLHREQNPSRH